MPVQFHIVRGLSMTKQGVEMQSWITQAEIRQAVLPEVNRIWRDAAIVFHLVGVAEARVVDLPERERLIAEIVAAERDRQGKSDPKRIEKLDRLIDSTTAARDAVNVYLVPYLGHTSQGNTARRRRRIFVAQWTDKKVKPGQPPERFQLVESAPFRKGSLSRTVAHELGHVLGLKHPDKSRQSETGLLMGGKRPGYRLTADDIRTARATAKRLRDRL